MLRITAKLQWLQDPSEINGENLNNVRSEASRHFRNKKMEYLKGKINGQATNSKNKNIRDLYRGINEFKRGYQPRNNSVKDKNGDLDLVPVTLRLKLLLQSRENINLQAVIKFLWNRFKQEVKR
jgi:hypothetical protein